VSTCISHNGEFSEHVYQVGGGAAFLCKRCWMFDDDAAMEEINRLEGDLAVAVHEATEARGEVERLQEALNRRLSPAADEWLTKLHDRAHLQLRSRVWRIVDTLVHQLDAERQRSQCPAAAPVQPEETPDDH